MARLVGELAATEACDSSARLVRSTRNFIAMIDLMHGEPPNLQPI